MLIHFDGNLLGDHYGLPWFTPDFVSLHILNRVACTRETPIDMTSAEYVTENEILTGAELKQLLELLHAEYTKFNQEQHTMGTIPEAFSKIKNKNDFTALMIDREACNHSCILFHNALIFAELIAKIDTAKYYSIAFADESMGGGL